MKFKLKQEVYYLKGTQIKSGIITKRKSIDEIVAINQLSRLEMEDTESKQDFDELGGLFEKSLIEYSLNTHAIPFYESDLFESKQELLNAITEQI